MTTPDVPVEAQQQIRKAVDTALSTPSTAQGLISNMPDLSKVGGQVTEVLDTVIAGLGSILEYKWLIPDQYEQPLDALLSALKKVRGWLH